MTPKDKAIEKLTALRVNAQELVDAYTEALDGLNGSSELIDTIQTQADALVAEKDVQLAEKEAEILVLKQDKPNEGILNEDII